jgi:hypothetical protein
MGLYFFDLIHVLMQSKPPHTHARQLDVESLDEDVLKVVDHNSA